MKQYGESVPRLLYYWFPELVSLFIIVALPPLFDNYLLAGLGSTAAYGILGLASNLVHNCIKFSEAIPVASIAIIGRFNGAKNYSVCGQELVTSFWTCCIVGFLQFTLLFFGASAIYRWLGVPEAMVSLGAPLLRLRAFSILLAFILWAFVYFLRALKNTKTPMLITLVGTTTYLISASVLIPGRWGIPSLGVYGAAYAALLQYSVMLGIALWHIFRSPQYRRYFNRVKMFSFHPRKMLHLVVLSIPIMIDKSSLSFAYVWLSKMIAPLGANAIASFDLIKNLERTAIMPAAAFAQVITFLVSNYIGAQNGDGAKATIKKVILLTALFVGIALTVLCTGAPYFIGRISPSPEVSQFAIPMLRMISVLVIFDFLQLLLAGALRGSGNFHIVMWGRFITCFFFFIPLSTWISGLHIENTFYKFGLMYGAFYINTALMGLIFLFFIMRRRWYRKHL